MERPPVTVLIPCCREPEKILRAAIDSLLGQTFTNWRAVLIDDAPDESGFARILDSYQDDRLCYVKNLGPHGIANAWNLGIESVHTELFSFLHADDELESDYLDTMIGLARSYSDGWLYACGATVIDEQGNVVLPLGDAVKRLIAPIGRISTLQGIGSLGRLLIGNYIFCPTLLYRSSKVHGRVFEKSFKFVLDLAYTSKVLLDGGTIVITKYAGYRYRRLPASGTQQYTKSGVRFDEELALQHELAREVARRGFRVVAFLGHASLTVRLHIILRIMASLMHWDWHAIRANAARLAR
jgi:glycosyltransferase involved in cell wall biosynthesis